MRWQRGNKERGQVRAELESKSVSYREQTGCQGGGGREWDGLGVWGESMQTITLRMDKP